MPRSGVIACVFDFDETLTPDTTSLFLRSRGLDPEAFWGSDVKALVNQGFDPTLAWLQLFLEMVGPEKPLGLLTHYDLRAFGATLDSQLFPGVTDLIPDLKKLVSTYRDLVIEFYVVSGGLREIILGSPFVAAEFDGVYACEFGTDDSDRVERVKRCVTFTEKTRYLFEINKGIDPDESSRNPYLVNRAVADVNRRVPLDNMIYVGDGLTDIPCFSLVGRAGGYALGVFDPSEESRARRALAEFLRPHRVVSMHSPRYGETDDLGAILRAAVASIATRLELHRTDAYDAF